MTLDRAGLTLILLILALFTGATIEISEGSSYTGIGLFFIAMILVTRLRLSSSTDLNNSKLYLPVGFFIVISDLIYNFVTKSSLGTLDTMTFFLGMSLMAFGMRHQQIRRIGEFGTYVSIVFTILFFTFYILFGKFDINFIHIFDHYLILLPTVIILKFFGIPVEVISTETVHLRGIEDMTIVIGGPCSGLYSMFLLIGIVIGYNRIEKIEPKKTLLILGLSILIAYISNLFRIIILYLTAYTYGQEAMMIVHTHLGWIIFAVVAGFIIKTLEFKNKI